MSIFFPDFFEQFFYDFLAVFPQDFLDNFSILRTHNSDILVLAALTFYIYFDPTKNAHFRHFKTQYSWWSCRILPPGPINLQDTLLHA